MGKRAGDASGQPALDELKRGQILGILAVGCSRRVAADYVGCSLKAIQDAAAHDPQFAEGLRRAEQQAEIGYLRRIHEAASEPKYWRAAAWVLERKNPQDFGLRRPETVTVDQVKQLMVGLTALIVDEVPVAVYRKMILKRVDELIRSAFASKSRKSRVCRKPPKKGSGR